MNKEDRIEIRCLTEEFKKQSEWHKRKDEKTQEHRVEITQRITAVETVLENLKDLKKITYETAAKVGDYDDVKKKVVKNLDGIQSIKTVWTTIIVVISLLAAGTTIYANFDKIFH